MGSVGVVFTTNGDFMGALSRCFAERAGAVFLGSRGFHVSPLCVVTAVYTWITLLGTESKANCVINGKQPMAIIFSEALVHHRQITDGRMTGPLQRLMRLRSIN